MYGGSSASYHDQMLAKLKLGFDYSFITKKLSWSCDTAVSKRVSWGNSYHKMRLYWACLWCIASKYHAITIKSCLSTSLYNIRENKSLMFPGNCKDKNGDTIHFACKCLKWSNFCDMIWFSESNARVFIKLKYSIFGICDFPQEYL